MPFTVPRQGISRIKYFLHKGVASKLMGNSTDGAVWEFAVHSFLAHRIVDACSCRRHADKQQTLSTPLKGDKFIYRGNTHNKCNERAAAISLFSCHRAIEGDNLREEAD